MIFGALLLLALGCSPRVLPPNVIETMTDTVIRERVVIDTCYVEIPKEVEKVITRDTISCLENSYAKSEAIVSGGFLSHTLESIPQRIYVPVETIVRDTVVLRQQAETVIKEVEKELSWMQRTSIIGFWSIVSLIALALALKVLKVLGKI